MAEKKPITKVPVRSLTVRDLHTEPRDIHVPAMPSIPASERGSKPVPTTGIVLTFAITADAISPAHQIRRSVTFVKMTAKFLV